ncbi:MAG TPA: AarF/UbiB family protein [Ktedonosporobacter sp.]|jgi:predicted unusual protein kinase regulating ubiquinone biosynthesis (AarF/ABC1/UbiB family)|nr:AarF/UbiB family protein [Ktedonosporobacter sp.]
MYRAKTRPQTQSGIGIGMLAKALLAAHFTRHPRRYIEIFHIMHKYHLLRVAAQLGMVNQQSRQCGRSELETDNICAENAERLSRALEELGPCFIKFGQVMSTRPDLLPPPFIVALSRLQDGITPVAGDAIIAIVERELGAPLSKLFRSFDPHPLATASIAQVHQATLPDGTPVVVKVQRPGVRAQVEKDIEVMQEITRFASRHTSLNSHYGLAQIIQEIKISLSQELDFQQEADNTRLVSQGMREFPHLVTPQVYPNYNSQQVLTVSFLHGRHLAQVPRAELRQIDTVTIAQELLSAYIKQMVVDGTFHCDPHPGNILLTTDGRLALLDFGMVGRFDAEQKEQILLLLLAFAERQGERVADIYTNMIEIPHSCDRQGFTQQICTLISRYHDRSNDHIEIGKGLLEVAALAQSYQMAVPAQLTLLGKAMLNLDGTLRVLAPELNFVQIIKNYMERIMEERALTHLSTGRAYSWFLDTRRLVDHLPRKTNTIIDKLAHDQFTIQIKIHSLEGAIRQAAHKLSFGMIVSSLMLSLSFWFMSKEKNKNARLPSKRA